MPNEENDKFIPNTDYKNPDGENYPVGVNGRLDFYEVKRDIARIDLAALKSKTEAFFDKNPELRSLESECRGLSLADV